MKNFLVASLVAISVTLPNKTASSPTPRLDPNVVKITNVIQQLQPALEANQAHNIAVAVNRNSKATGIDWRIAVAIMFQESSLTLDPQNCKVNFTRCNDMGIGQVRYSVWGSYFKIDKKRMVTDIDYAVGKVFKILAIHKQSHGTKEFNWFTRYHSKTPTLRYEYMKRLNKAYAKINSIKD